MAWEDFGHISHLKNMKKMNDTYITQVRSPVLVATVTDSDTIKPYSYVLGCITSTLFALIVLPVF
jgi:hypothetical protein